MQVANFKNEKPQKKRPLRGQGKTNPRTITFRDFHLILWRQILKLSIMSKNNQESKKTDKQSDKREPIYTERSISEKPLKPPPQPREEV